MIKDEGSEPRGPEFEPLDILRKLNDDLKAALRQAGEGIALLADEPMMQYDGEPGWESCLNSVFGSIRKVKPQDLGSWFNELLSDLISNTDIKSRWASALPSGMSEEEKDDVVEKLENEVCDVFHSVLKRHNLLV